MGTLRSLFNRAVARGSRAAWFARTLARVREAPVVAVLLGLLSVNAGRWAWVAWWAVVAALLVLLRLADDGAGEACVDNRVRTSWWGWRMYGRRWARLMADAGLADPADGAVPCLLRAQRTPSGDRLTVQTLRGQSADDLARRSDFIAEALGATHCAVRRSSPGVVWLEVVWAHGRVEILAVGRREDSAAWRIRLDSNILVVGEPGTGTSSLMRSIASQADPLVQTGRIELWVADTSGGMQIPDIPRYAKYELDTAGTVRLLDAARREVRGRLRNAHLRESERHQSSGAYEPQVIVVIDDVSTALAGAAAEQADSRRRIVRSLHIVLAEGPAVGVILVGVFKELNRTALGWRHLFKTRVAFRLADPAATDLVLGPGARRLGATCEQIPTPPAGTGTAYAWSYDDAAPVLVQVDDDGSQLRSA